MVGYVPYRVQWLCRLLLHYDYIPTGLQWFGLGKTCHRVSEMFRRVSEMCRKRVGESRKWLNSHVGRYAS